ncbi:hypothetical protein [Sphingomicrobium clamense]|uniref:Uncharacterized protein n=1 Tax=Sphingomicrobium clamense TaxID=2851013 RepID=A0ABS6V8B2_9SPHN|nr:hypothetical protein [Sphingomicrobium sp. B8]MBW0145801.1 hypothetical protein [Sphingomicrobium sp. B8]
MKIIGFAALAAMSAVACASPVSAQDATIERAPLDWYYVSYVNYNPDEREWVEEWQENYLIPAYKAAGMVPPKYYHMNTGRWEMIVINHMPGGPDMMSWAENPMAEKIDAELVKLVGSEEELAKMRKRYADAQTDWTGGLGHIDRNE